MAAPWCGYLFSCCQHLIGATERIKPKELEAKKSTLSAWFSFLGARDFVMGNRECFLHVK